MAAGEVYRLKEARRRSSNAFKSHTAQSEKKELHNPAGLGE
jgi:hypothetical protein